MRPKKKIMLAINGDELEKPPVLPLIGAHSAVLAGINPVKAFYDGRLMARLQVKAARFYRPDGVFHYMDLTLEAEALGANVEFKGHFPAVVRHCVPGDIEFDENDGRIKEFISAIKMLSEELGDELFIGSYVTGPLTLAMELLGSREVARWLVKKSNIVDDMLPKLSSFVSSYARALIDAGADGVMILEPCCALASPRVFKSIVPFLNRICHAVSSRDAYPFLHICGDTTHLLNLFPEVDASVYHVDSAVSLEGARRVLGCRCLMGNVDTSALLTSDKESIFNAAKKCVEEAGIRCYILSAGCEVPPRTPPENLKALITAVRDT